MQRTVKVGSDIIWLAAAWTAGGGGLVGWK